MASLLKIISTTDAKQMVHQVHQPTQGIRWCYGCRATHLQATFLALQNNMVEELHCNKAGQFNFFCTTMALFFNHKTYFRDIYDRACTFKHWQLTFNVHTAVLYIYILNLSSTLDSIDVSPSLRSFSICAQKHLETLCRMLNFGHGLFIKLATVTARLFLTRWRSCETHFTSEAKSYDGKTWS